MQYFRAWNSDIRYTISINLNLEETAELTQKASIEKELENAKVRAVFFAKLINLYF